MVRKKGTNNSMLASVKPGPEHLTKEFNDIIQKKRREEEERKFEEERKAR